MSSIFHTNKAGRIILKKADTVRLIHHLRVLNSERANAKSDEERIRLSDEIIVLKRKLRAEGEAE